MVDVANLGLRVDSRDVRGGRKDLDDFARSGKRAAEAGDRVGKSGRTIAAGMSAARAGLAAVTGALTAIGGSLALSNDYTNMTNSLRSLGMTGDQAADRLAKIGEMAARTRAPLGATTQLYQRITIAAKDIGASGDDVMRFTENVGLALAQGGVSADQASGALLQLSQAMAGGTVRAEEFNSILEGAYPIALAAAQGIDAAGGSVGRLRQLVVDGKVSSEEFFNAILGQTDQLEEAFANTVPTIGQAFTVLRNNLTLFVGSNDAAIGASAALARAILVLAENVDRLVIYAGTAALLIGGGYVAAVAMGALRTMTLVRALGLLRMALIRTGIGIVVVAAGELVYQFTRLVEATGSFGNAMVVLKDVALEVWDRIEIGGQVLEYGLKSIFASIRAAWFGILASMQGAWSTFLQNVAGGLARVNAATGTMGDALNSVVGAMGESSAKEHGLKTQQFLAERSAANNKITAQDAYDSMVRPLASLEALQAILNSTTDAEDGAAAAAERLNSALTNLGGGGGGSGGGGGGSADAAAKALDELKNAAERWTEETLTPLEKYGLAVAELDTLLQKGLITQEVYTRGITKSKEEMQNATPAYQDALDWVERTKTATERYNEELERLGALYNSGAIDAETFKRGIELLNDELENSKQAQDELVTGLTDPIKRALQEGAFSFQTWVDAVVNIGQNFAGRLIKLAFDPIESAIDKLFKTLMDNVGSGGGLFGGGGGLFGGALGNLFGGGGGAFNVASFLPGFATGGVAHGVFVAGEAGPEIIKAPAGGARVYSNDDSRKMMGGSTYNIHQTFDMRGANVSEAHMRKTAGEAAESAVRGLLEQNNEYPVIK